MYINFTRWTREREQRPGDLRVDLEYLLSPKLTEAIGVRYSRLAGPPETRGLIQVIAPWEPTLRDAARDLANQMDRFRRTVFVTQPIPRQWYVNFFVSFDPRAKSVLSSPTDSFEIPAKNFSLHKNALRVTHDVLDALGCAEDHVGVFVVHTDRPHIHVHGVVVLAQNGGHRWDPFVFTTRHLKQVCATASNAFLHPSPKRRIKMGGSMTLPQY